MISPAVDDVAGVGRARRAWLSALGAHVRAAEKHAAAAAVHARFGRLDRQQIALDRLAEERVEFDEALAMHPEWADAAPVWPQLDSDVVEG